MTNKKYVLNKIYKDILFFYIFDKEEYKKIFNENNETKRLQCTLKNINDWSKRSFNFSWKVFLKIFQEDITEKTEEEINKEKIQANIQIDEWKDNIE